MNKDKYNSIINIKHYDPNQDKHPRMSMSSRAAQFAPFAALIGYEDSIKEKSRAVSMIPTLTDDDLNLLNDRISYLKYNLNTKVCVEYYILDKFKEGCTINQKEGIIKHIDEVFRFIKFLDDEIIYLDRIININFI